MLDTLGSFFALVDGILWLDAAVIQSIQTSPSGLGVAIAILVLATLSDVVGNSPVLFFRKMRPGRLALAMAIEAVLSIIRLCVWILCVWLLLWLLNGTPLDLRTLVLVIGIGYAPMLWSFLIIIPSAGPLIGRILVAWTLVTMTASIALSSASSPVNVVAGPVIAALVLLLVYRGSNRITALVLGGLSRRFSGVDVMQRTRAMDPVMVAAARQGLSERRAHG